MRKVIISVVACLLFIAGWAAIWLNHSRNSDRLIHTVFDAYQESAAYPALTVEYPYAGSCFPPEIAAPVFRWTDTNAQAIAWVVSFRFQDQTNRLDFISPTNAWTPSEPVWAQIKQLSVEKPATVTLLGFNPNQPGTVVSRGRVTLVTSKDETGAPIFYREVNLPFFEAVKDPSRIRWCMGTVDSARHPTIVLEKLPVCGNCHSFPRDGGLLAMDVDYANNKGSYIITPTAKEMTLATSDIITWDDYRKEDGQPTFGLLSQISPDGRFVVSTVKDKSVFVPRPELAFSQLFFPIRGILVCYRRDTRTFHALPGADDPDYVQSNPTWSPDGKYLIFARAKAYQLRKASSSGKIMLTPEECEEFLKDGKPFQFDLYRIPFNEGQGGKPEPLSGASLNGFSNYFPKYSPDGRWIVFCRAKNYMLLQPDSELFIIPAEGGPARRLRCNLPVMNSWHSWSPNGRWMVFSSKVNGPYTQLFLTHMDEQGNSAPPVLLAHFTDPDRAANIPEFVNLKAGGIEKIQAKFLDDVSFLRAAYTFEMSKDIDSALREYQKALAANPGNATAHQRLGFLLYNAKRQPQEGLAHTLEALRLDPANGFAHYDLAMALFHQDKLDQAVPHFLEALRLLPEGFDKRYNPADMHFNLGGVLMFKEDYRGAVEHLSKATLLAPENARMRYNLALALAHLGSLEESLAQYSKAVVLNASIDTAPALHDLLSQHFAQAGQFKEAVQEAEKALKLAETMNEKELAAELRQRLMQYQQNLK